MVTVEYEVIEMLVPLMIVMIPAIITYAYIQNKAGFMGGATVGIVVGVSAGILESWVLILGILGLATVLFLEPGMEIVLGRGED